MIRHVEAQKLLERENYHTYWRLHLPKLLNTTKKVFAQKNINTNNTSTVGQIVKGVQTFYLFSPGIWLCKEHYPMHVMEKFTGNNLTR